MSNPKFDQIIKTMQELESRKRNDYAHSDSPYSNFEFSAVTAGITIEQVFLNMIGIKIARIKELSSGKVPNFESLQDSRIDLSVYTALYASYFLEDTK